MFKLDLEKAKKPEIKLLTSVGSYKKQENSRKKKYNSASLTMLKPLTVWITQTVKILEKMEIPDHFICLLRNLYAGQEATDRTRHVTTDWSKIGKGVCQGYILSRCLLMQSTSCEMPGYVKHKLESRLLGEISITSDMQMTLPFWQKEEELKSLLMKVKEESEKVGLKLSIQKMNIMASGPITSW